MPETVGPGDFVFPVPDWMKAHTRRLPEPAEIQPWFDTVTPLWDGPVAGDTWAAAARHAVYDEDRQRARTVAYPTSLSFPARSPR